MTAKQRKRWKKEFNREQDALYKAIMSGNWELHRDLLMKYGYADKERALDLALDYFGRLHQNQQQAI